MTNAIEAPPITAEAFAPFGEVIDLVGRDPILINDGLCERYSDLASFDVLEGRLGLSFFQSEIRDVPYTCGLLERHPLGSQCFLPLGGSAFLVIVAPDAGGRPGPISAWTAEAHQGVNIARNTWHGVLAPISGSGLFAVLDRIGAGPNLDEHTLADPAIIWPRRG